MAEGEEEEPAAFEDGAADAADVEEADMADESGVRDGKCSDDHTQKRKQIELLISAE